MSQSVKLSDGSYIDAGAVWDNTSQKTLEEIIPLKSNQLVMVKYSTTASTTLSNGAYKWECDLNKEGYTLLMASVGHAWSSKYMCMWEGLYSNNTIWGYANQSGLKVYILALYVKN